MDQSASRAAASTVQITPSELNRLLPGLNALAEALLVARAREDDAWRRAVSISRLVTLGMERECCRDLLARGLIVTDGKLCASCRAILTDAGLAFLQRAIPSGAIRPVYDVESRELSVAGEIVLQLAVQARNLSAFLAALESAGWPPRVVKPLNGRPCGNDAHRLAVTAHSLSAHQLLIDFHTDDGAATWNWRRAAGPRTSMELGLNLDRT